MNKLDAAKKIFANRPPSLDRSFGSHRAGQLYLHERIDALEAVIKLLIEYAEEQKVSSESSGNG